jgi:hypothetical protein
MDIERQIIPEFLDDAMLKAIKWGRSNPEDMKKEENPFGYTDVRWNRWRVAKYAEMLAGMTVEQQKEQYKTNMHLFKKMSS